MKEFFTYEGKDYMAVEGFATNKIGKRKRVILVTWNDINEYNWAVVPYESIYPHGCLFPELKELLEDADHFFKCAKENWSNDPQNMQEFMTWDDDPDLHLKEGLYMTRDSVGQSCNSGGYQDVEITDWRTGEVVWSGRSCNCGRGCYGYDCIRDDWGYHDTDIEFLRRGGKNSDNNVYDKC